MNFDVLRAANSNPEYQVDNDVNWMALNRALMYDAVLPLNGFPVEYTLSEWEEHVCFF